MDLVEGACLLIFGAILFRNMRVKEPCEDRLRNLFRNLVNINNEGGFHISQRPQGAQPIITTKG